MARGPHTPSLSSLSLFCCLCFRLPQSSAAQVWVAAVPTSRTTEVIKSFLLELAKVGQVVAFFSFYCFPRPARCTVRRGWGERLVDLLSQFWKKRDTSSAVCSRLPHSNYTEESILARSNLPCLIVRGKRYITVKRANGDNLAER